jgi:hypothetical protein
MRSASWILDPRLAPTPSRSDAAGLERVREGAQHGVLADQVLEATDGILRASTR